MKPTISPPGLRLAQACGRCAFSVTIRTLWPYRVGCQMHAIEVLSRKVCDDYEEPKAFCYLGYVAGVGDVYGSSEVTL